MPGPNRASQTLVLSAATLVLCAAPVTASASRDDDTSASEGRTTIFWVSIDGFRPDYVERADTPALDRLIDEGAFTRRLAPGFPSVTFSSHVTQVTGVHVDRHGVPGNTFYDSATGEQYRYPGPYAMVESEAIWETATRQGIRVAVFDWPMSHQQEGEHAAAYFGDGYNPRLPDQVRINQALDAWEQDEHDQPLQLLMGYAVSVDRPGHRFGPDSDLMVGPIEDADTLVGDVLDRAVSLWRRNAGDDDEFYFIMSTDHGMSPVRAQVHPGRLLDVADRTDIRIVTSANVGNVFLDQIEDEAERETLIEHMVAAAEKHDFANVYHANELADSHHYIHPTRTGDLIVIMDTGYTFSTRIDALTADPQDTGGPLGMHGYDHRDDPNMYGLGLIWRYPEPLGGIDLREVNSTQLHATVARLLGIEPAEHAAEAVKLPAAEEASALAPR